MSTNDCYSPDTGEHIHTDNPSEWMGRSGTPAPAYDRSNAGCFWRNGAWVVVASTAQAEAAAAGKAAVLAQAKMIRGQALDRLTGIRVNDILPTDTATLTAISAARTDLKNLPTCATVMAATDGDTTKAAVMTEWRRIALNLATDGPDAANAFAGLGM